MIGLPLADDRNGFNTRDSPYVSNLTYDLRQVAVFGEATYTLFDRLGPDRRVALVRLGRRQDLQIGWFAIRMLAARDQNETVSSNGFTPRFMVNYDVTDRVAVNAQASRGFRLGGFNDPLNKS